MMKKSVVYIGIWVLLLVFALPLQAASEAEFRKLSKHYTLRADGSQEVRVKKELTLFTHTAMNGLYGETFITYNPDFQTLEIHDSYTRQKDGTIVKTPANAFVEVLPSAAADAPAYNHLKEMVVVHTGLELGATVYLDYSIVSRPGYLPELDVFCPVKELCPIREFTCTIEVQADKELHYELLNSSASAKILDVKGKGKTVVWTLKNVAPRPYAYPVSHGNDGLSAIQETASGMMPVIIASTYPDYAAALKHLQKQFVAGDEAVVRAKAEELTKEAGGDRQKKADAIGEYMSLLYSRLGVCGVSLQDAGYRLRPASEVIRSGYGTMAELVNLDVTLQRSAGLDAKVAVCAVRPSNQACMGLSGITAFVAKSEVTPMKVALRDVEQAELQSYMTVTDLYGCPLQLNRRNGETPNLNTIKVSDATSRMLPDGYRVVELSEPFSVLYPYAANTSITENILLPRTQHIHLVTSVELPQGSVWVEKADKEISNEFGKVSFRYEEEAGKVKVTRVLQIEKLLVTPADYKEFYALMAEWKDKNNHTLVLK